MFWFSPTTLIKRQKPIRMGLVVNPLNYPKSDPKCEIQRNLPVSYFFQDKAKQGAFFSSYEKAYGWPWSFHGLVFVYLLKNEFPFDLLSICIFIK